MKALEALDLPFGENHARNLWLVSFYFAGMRISDVLRLKWSDFQNGRLYYAMGKNLKAGSLKVPEKVLEILQQYPRNNAHDLVFFDLAKMPDLSKSYEVQSYIKARVRSCNDYLKNVAVKLQLTKPLSMHIARHSFAQISADRIPANILQRLYRHSDIKTTMGYQSNFINKTTDDALDSVINL
ncbi:tyrosine-type recombinase/integrase [Dyadobacter helix]|uniref:tyrosine-type recombinase/integrase n=1 Tax=Dyadobacter helix TaxID=2822344 RepID=UPI001BFC8DA5|nr:tyrosine-type recombinase/integrase [Dyadobacter sp. CECT 9275]